MLIMMPKLVSGGRWHRQWRTRLANGTTAPSAAASSSSPRRATVKSIAAASRWNSRSSPTRASREESPWQVNWASDTSAPLVAVRYSASRPAREKSPVAARKWNSSSRSRFRRLTNRAAMSRSAGSASSEPRPPNAATASMPGSRAGDSPFPAWRGEPPLAAPGAGTAAGIAYLFPTREKNSARLALRRRNSPLSAEVMMLLPGFLTPRITMHMCSA